MDYKEEFRIFKTCSGWKYEEVPNEPEYWPTRLMFKDCLNEANLKEKLAIRIASLMLYNNIEPDESEVFNTVEDIIKIGNIEL
jgi:hypothetical protein